MPADLSKLIVAAESATAETQVKVIFDIAGQLHRMSLISAETYLAVRRVIAAVQAEVVDASCLLGAALLLVPSDWRVREMKQIDRDSLWRVQAVSAKHGHDASGHTLALAITVVAIRACLINSSLRALQAAGATEAGR